MMMIRRLMWEFLRGKRETQPVHGSHIYIYINKMCLYIIFEGGGVDQVEQRDGDDEELVHA
jgi:hypothetical protein